MTNKELEAKVKELEEENEKLKSAAGTEPVVQQIILPDPARTPMIPYEEKEFVKIKLFKDEYRYKNDLYVGINGKNWWIRRGKEVTVPKYVADFIEQTMQEETKIWERVEEDEKNYKSLTEKQV